VNAALLPKLKQQGLELLSTAATSGNALQHPAWALSDRLDQIERCLSIYADDYQLLKGAASVSVFELLATQKLRIVDVPSVGRFNRRQPR
jgi:hypothetical protein